MQNYAEQNRIQYFADILILTGLVVLCALVFGILGALLASFIFHIDYNLLLNQLSGTSETSNIGFLKFYNVFSTTGAWVVSGFLLSKIRSFNVNSLWHFRVPPVRFIWFLLPVLFISATFISAYLLDINQRLPIPESIRSAFDSFNTGGLLERMLVMNSYSDLFVNLIVIALFPAVFEEIFFRGTLQPLVNGLFNNHHLGIWFCSLVFALIHLNITQLLPMTFLALVLGYLFHYSGSIYPGILLHFTNNAMAVLAYYFQDRSEMAKKIVDDTFKPEIWHFVVFSIVLVTVFGFMIQQYKLHKNHE